MPPSLSDIETQLRTGRGIAIIVEGETSEDDPYFFRKWFDDRADQITFFPQDGWLQVQTAVAHLRHSSRVPVFGILDRDFCDDHELDARFDGHGLIRTRCYTLENYLLSPTHWAEVFKTLYRRDPKAAQWGDEAFVENQITEAYQDCLPLSAHNYVVKQVNEWIQIQPSNAIKTFDYLETVKALKDIKLRLTNWGKDVGYPKDLGLLYEQQLDGLKKISAHDYELVVSGKYVLDALFRKLPKIPKQGKFQFDTYINQYAVKDLPIPTDLAQLIDRILNAKTTKTL